MKYLLVFAVVALAIWLWRSNRREALRDAAPRRPRTVSGPQTMVRCAHCGLHLPAAEAVNGRHGTYCCDAHRQIAEV